MLSETECLDTSRCVCHSYTYALTPRGFSIVHSDRDIPISCSLLSNDSYYGTHDAGSEEATFRADAISRIHSAVSTILTIESSKERLQVHGSRLARFYHEVRMCHEVEVVVQQRPAVMVGVVVLVSDTGIATDDLFPPVWHTVLVSIPIGSTMLLRIVLPAVTCRMLGDVGLAVYLALDARLGTLICPCTAQRLLDITQMLLVALRHGGTRITGHNLQGILSRVNGSIGGEEGCIIPGALRVRTRSVVSVA